MECLVKKSKGVVDNNNLEKLGVVKFKAKRISDTFDMFCVGTNLNFTISSETAFSVCTYNTTFTGDIIAANVNSYTFTMGASRYIAIKLLQDGWQEFEVTNKYNISDISNRPSNTAEIYSVLDINLDQLKFSPILTLRLGGDENNKSIISGNLPACNYTSVILSYSDYDKDITDALALGNFGRVDIISSKATINLDSLNVFISEFYGSKSKMKGDLKNYVENIKNIANNRKLSVIIPTGKCTIDGVVPSKATWHVNFGTSMENPTAEETAQGYQIV